MVIVSIVVSIAILVRELKRKGVKKPFLYGTITCLSLAFLFIFAVESEYYWLTAFGLFLFFISMLSITCILSVKNTDSYKFLFYATKSKNDNISNDNQRKTKFLNLKNKYSRTIKILSLMLTGFSPVFIIILISTMILGGISIRYENSFVGEGDQALTEPDVVPLKYLELFTLYGLVFITFVFGIVTLIITFIFGLFFYKNIKLVGLITGLWIGLFNIWVQVTEPLYIRLYIASICVLCGYLGGYFSFRVHNLILRRTRKITRTHRVAEQKGD